MSKIRKIFASSVMGALLVADATAAVQINFDSPSDLTDNFTISFNTGNSGPNATPAAYNATSGLGGSGGLLLQEDSKDQYAILNTPFALAPGTVYTVSAYIRSVGYVGVGFTDAVSYTSIDFQPDNSVMLSASDESSMNVSNYVNAVQEWNNPNTITSPPDIGPGDWMALNLSMTYTGVNSFDLSYTIDLCDGNGNTVAPAFNGAYSITNSGFSGNLYPFIFFQDDFGVPGQIAADNFFASASAVPEPSTAMVAMIGLTLGFTTIRRRRQSADS